ncbi:Fur family transcriptional regulator [Demequina mangrovi]|uniref:Fur family transcriptional regulator, ferric uptake regulator n=1 Tax=Demequina mangrovi TaxID=1043493 RepID=A0A1H6ZVM1_9MICO|nr:Fur family transcriptional regulator [Demequina mangrovi]SEJ57391.1 Fur family transcriptional regulator, ferric uptake regulator [Demequina mangrovi]
MTLSDATGLLRGAGLRVTEPRRAVLEALEGLPHASADAIHAQVVRTLPDVSLQTVYNVLRDLTGSGLTRSIEPGDHPARYELRVGDNHHHLVCTRCSAIVDVDCVVGHAPCLTPNESHGFVLNEAEVTFWGLCLDCQAAVGLASDPVPSTH